MEIGRLYVTPQAQDRGVGSRLLTALLAEFPKPRSYRLDVDPRNTRAIAFYARHGFVVIARGENCAGSGLPHLIMQRSCHPG